MVLNLLDGADVARQQYHNVLRRSNAIGHEKDGDHLEGQNHDSIKQARLIISRDRCWMRTSSANETSKDGLMVVGKSVMVEGDERKMEKINKQRE